MNAKAAATSESSASIIGQPLLRKEDARLVTGRGLYVDDVRIPGALFVGFVRSSHAHALVRKVHKEKALAVPGVLEVIAPGDIPELSEALPELIGAGTLKNPYVDHFRVPPQALLPHKASFVGEQVVAVVALTPYAAADGVEAVEIDYEQLPVVANIEASIRPGAPRIHEGYDNVVAHLRHKVGDIEAAFAQADVIIEQHLEMQSLKSMAIECRGSVAQWNRATGSMNVWSTCHLFYMIRDALARIMKLPYDQIRIISKDTGGSFGLKGVLHPEDLIVPIIARHLDVPLRWSETRLEHMTAANHSGRQLHDVRTAAMRDGRILAIDVKMHKDVGSYNHFEMVLQTNTVNHMTTHYKIPNMRFEGWAVATNTPPGSPFRGAGRVEATFTMDRVLDAVARETQLDPADVRRANIITPADMPYRNGLTYRDGIEITHEDADYPLMLETALETADYKGWRARQRETREDETSIGIGISSYVEAGGIGPSEGATIKVEDTGKVFVSVGVNSAGQSHETTLAQACAETLGVRYEDVEVLGGDTSLQRIGFGTGASRVAVNAGNAVLAAAKAVRRKAATLAATIFGCDEDLIEIVDGVVSIRGDRQDFLSLGDLAGRAWRHPIMKDLGGPGLFATEFFYPRTVVWSSGVHVAVVELDRRTGRITFPRYVVVHDCGIPLNLMVVEGQIYGGFAQGFGIALGEETLYDDNAQVLSGSLMDYYVARAEDVPPVELHHLVFPSSNNPLGVKSVGESGPISPPAAIAAAIEDALGHGVSINRLPITAGFILSACRAQRAAKSENAE
jgi:aerobic carbon-monoxide dehydrogenase large subunit